LSQAKYWDSNSAPSFSLCQVTLDEKRKVTADFSLVWSSSEDVTKYKSYFSLPEFIKFPTVIPGQHAYAYFYAPYNHSFQGSSNEKPPLLVRTHGTVLVLFFNGSNWLDLPLTNLQEY
jgi:hypothetical protein